MKRVPDWRELTELSHLASHTMRWWEIGRWAPATLQPGQGNGWRKRQGSRPSGGV